MILQLIYWAVLCASCGYAAWRGGTPERAGAAIMAIGSVLSVVVTSDMGVRFRGAEIGIMIVDAAVLVAFLAVALRSDRFWPLWAAAFQAIAIATHVAAVANPAVFWFAYALAQGFWAYPMLLAIVIGTWHRNQRQSRTEDARSC